MKKCFYSYWPLVVILSLALIVRFLYFPNNIYFGFDQARDAFSAIEILNGDFKIIGPTTAFEGLHHGVLYYYILAPLYGLGQMSPEVTAAVWRIFNASGVFLIFCLTTILFNKKAAIFSALLYALSFEQTQFAIFLHHPPLVILSMMLMYLGLAQVIFAKKNYSLILAFLGLGFSIQFEFPLLYLTIPFVLIILFFHKYFIKIPKKIIFLSILSFILSIFTFIAAELKYGFPTLNGLLALSKFNPGKTIETIINTYLYTVSMMVRFNFTGAFLELPTVQLLMVFLFALFVWFLRKEEYRKRLIFLSIWFFSLAMTFIVNGGVSNLQRDLPLFYPNAGVSISLLIFASFLLSLIKKNYLSVFFFILFAFINLQMIQDKNLNGTISELTVQQGMILGNEKKVLDYIYNDASGQPFAVKAITMPFLINTTWSYLFEWYGLQKYGYLPLWNGKNAEGFAGNLIVEEAQEKLPKNRYLIIEPTRGVPGYLIDEYLKEENYFTNVDKTHTIGMFIIQKRVKY